MAITELKRNALRMNIVRLLYKKSPLPASVLARKLNVSLPTIRLSLNELIDNHIVVDSGVGVSNGGRKPIIYSLSGNAYHVMAVEMGHYEAKAVIVDCTNKEKTRVRTFTTNIDDPELENKTAKVMNELLTEAKLDKNRLTAIGVSMPGLIDTENGINLTIKDSSLRNIGKRLSERLKANIYIENDARMQALGEFVSGKASGTRNTLVINWSWGLGLGMIVNGKIYNGHTGCAGELSHIRVVDQGDLCDCGKRGCLQTIAGAKYLLNLAVKEIKKKSISRLTEKFSGKEHLLTTQDIIESALNGDELSISLLNNISTNLAWGLSILIQILNPQLIVLNGPFTKAGQYVVLPLMQALRQYCLNDIIENVRIEISDLEDHSGLHGVAVMAMEKIFRDQYS